jgi:type III secretion protein T
MDVSTPMTQKGILAIARPYGFTITFIAFAWFRANSGVIRMGIAAMMGFPVFSLAGPEFLESVHASNIPILLLAIKEMIVGAIIGWLISLPLSIASGAGSIIDTYRGSFQGSGDPTGGQISAIANLFMITSFGLFAVVGGFWIVTDLLYQSYLAWPIETAMPDITSGLEIFFSLLAKLVTASFILAAPIVSVMFLSDMTFLIAAKVGKKINVTFLAFSTKAIIAVALLPVFSLVFIQVQKKNFELFFVVDSFLKALIK